MLRRLGPDGPVLFERPQCDARLPCRGSRYAPEGRTGRVTFGPPFGESHAITTLRSS